MSEMNARDLCVMYCECALITMTKYRSELLLFIVRLHVRLKRICVRNGYTKKRAKNKINDEQETNVCDVR